MDEPVVVLVGTERHLHAEETADETVNAARPAGFDTVVALFLILGGGPVHMIGDVTVTVAADGPSVVSVTVEILERHCRQ